MSNDENNAAELPASPHPLFDPVWYARQARRLGHKDASFGHYLSDGWRHNLSPHPLFSIEYYFNKRNDLAEARIEPLTHFLVQGWKEGISPCPLFDIKHYLDRAGNINGLDPLTHYVTIGRFKGLSPHRYFDANYYVLCRKTQHLNDCDALIDFFSHGWRAGFMPSRFVNLDIQRDTSFLEFCEQLAVAVAENDSQFDAIKQRSAERDVSIVTWVPEAHDNLDVLRAANQIITIINEFSQKFGEIAYITALNFYAGGGAEWATLGYINQVSEILKPNILFLTDNGPRKEIPKLPRESLLIDISKSLKNMTYTQRSAVLFLVLKCIRPKIFHIINSEVAWNLFLTIPAGFLYDTNIIASVFALQFSDSQYENIVGYAINYLPKTIEKLKFVITDNTCFANEAPIILNIGEFKEKFRVVYNRSRLDGEIDSDSTLLSLFGRVSDLRSNKRLRVVWAGRLDKEKRVDLLLDIARQSLDFCDFYVHGDSVVDREEPVWGERLPSNITSFGAYGSPEDWDRLGVGHVFLFTSRWEGMPNALVEAAHLGYPIIATNVGGVSDLIRSDTGWLIDRFEGASAYVAALRQIQADPKLAIVRGTALTTLVHERHTGERQHFAFAQILEALL